MNRTHRETSASTAVACFALAVGIAACAAVGRSPVPSATDVAGQAASPASSSDSTAVPSIAEPGTIHVELANASRNAVSIDVIDASGRIVGAASGAPADGASVAPYAMTVANDDPATLRLTWAGGPCDGTSTLAVDAATSRLLLVQAECPGDAVAFDRVLILRFDGPVDAGTLETMVQDGTDTPG